MSTPPQHTAGEPESEPAEPTTASGEAPPSEPVTAPAQSRARVRDLTRWGIPFHYVPPVLVAVIGVVMLAIGGTVGTFGGWWLAAALPITIGAFLASPWFALLPVAVWVGWLIYVSGAPDDAALSNTPTLVGLMLAGIGAGATVLAQHAVFPATQRGAWQASIGRLVPPLDDGEPVELEDHTDEHTVDFAVVEPIEATDEELKAADAAAKEGATIAELPVVAERRAEAKKEAEDATEITDEAATEVSTEQAEDATEPSEDAEEQAEDAGEADETEAIDSSEATADGDPDPQEPSESATVPAEGKVDLAKAKPEPEPVPNSDIRIDLRRITELPLDADPAPLDEGGHVTEFAAISEADLTADEDAVEEAPETKSKATAESESEAAVESKTESKSESESESDDREPSSDDAEPATARSTDAPLPAATQAGQRNSGSKASSK